MPNIINLMNPENMGIIYPDSEKNSLIPREVEFNANKEAARKLRKLRESLTRKKNKNKNN